MRTWNCEIQKVSLISSSAQGISASFPFHSCALPRISTPVILASGFKVGSIPLLRTALVGDSEMRCVHVDVCHGVRGAPRQE